MDFPVPDPYRAALAAAISASSKRSPAETLAQATLSLAWSALIEPSRQVDRG